MKHKDHKLDPELAKYRDLMRVPSRFDEGVSPTAMLGTLIVALVMVPGALYMGLLAGESNVGPAAQWVTVILFIEAARRAQREVKRAEIFILFFMSGIAMSMPFGGLLWHQFYIQSEAARSTGLADLLPNWFAPAPESSESYALRTFLHPEWWPAIALILFRTFFSTISDLVLGYGLFRITSDIEKLPFPLAPIGAQGILALAEDTDEEESSPGSNSWRWKIFSIGSALGIGFGFIYLGLPALSTLLAHEPISLLPIPWLEFTPYTQGLLPAFATGINFDLTNLLIGMVLPFQAVLGSCLGLIATAFLNVGLYRADVLNSWRPGDQTIATMFKNNVDFYFSFQIGIALAVAFAGFWHVIKSWRQSGSTVVRSVRDASAGGAPKGRGDIRPTWVALCYVIVTLTYILVSGWLIDWHPGVMVVLVFFGFIYTPLISYVTARLEGLAGQVVEVPFIREASLILSGYQGVAVWLLPIPQSNYGVMTVRYRECELTGTKFTSMWKATALLQPIVLAASILFCSYIWSLAPIPSARYPFAEKMWELEALNRSLMWSSTLGDYSIFEDAIDSSRIVLGAGAGAALFAVCGWLGTPVLLTYGIIRGLGTSLPHFIIPQLIGALIGRYYFQKKFGANWMKYIPVLVAGFSCGMGLVTTLCIGFAFLGNAAIQLPY